MKIKIRTIIFVLLLISNLASFSFAEDEGGGLWPVPDYKGHIGERPALTGDWNGNRTYFAEKGITASLDLISTFQSVVDGGKRETEMLGGSIDYEVHMDFQKMGLWPGAFVRLYGETQYGNFINSSTGAALAANTDGLVPLVDDDTTTLTGAVFYQFLSESFGLFMGKIDTLDGDQNEFAHGRGNDQFMNQNLVFNTVTLRTTPVSALGGGLIFVLPGENNTLNFAVLDPGGQPDKTGFDDAFEKGVLFSGETRLEVNPFGLKGHQLLGGTYSTRNFTSIDQNLRLLVINLVTTGSLNLAEEEDSWSIYYNFDQYLYSEEGDPEQGFGLFGRIGFADDKTSPIERFYSIGIGGQGIIPGRDKDTFGIGYFYVELSDKLPGVFDVLDDGQGVEIFYNIEVNKWLHITPDYQIIDSGRKTNDTAHVFGIRTKVSF